MNERTITLIRSSWAVAAHTGDDIAPVFFDRLIQVAPGIKGLLGGDNEKRDRDLVQIVDDAVSSLCGDNQGFLQSTPLRHVAYLRFTYYDTIASVLFWTLRKSLGIAYTSEIYRAWSTSFAEVFRGMQLAAMRLEAVKVPI